MKFEVYKEDVCNLAFSVFLNIFQKRYLQTCPFITKKSKNIKSPKPWITKDILKLIKQKNKLFRKYKKVKIILNIIIINHLEIN